MKKIFSLLVLLSLALVGNSQSIVDQLHNSVERASGGSGATVEYHIFLAPTSEKIYRAHEWEKGQVVSSEGGAQYFELTRSKNGETEVMSVNLEDVAYIELEVKSVKGEKVFKYMFYF